MTASTYVPMFNLFFCSKPYHIQTSQFQHLKIGANYFAKIPILPGLKGTSTTGRTLSREDEETRRIMGLSTPTAITASNGALVSLCPNREERNAQTRERTRRLRIQDSIVSEDVLAARLEARREAVHKYQEKNLCKIALKARQARAQAANARAQARARAQSQS
ncbi:hypothetical protein C8F04DRAFT_1196531 [Mycena alexandri]|uniref:Uncharacterized protein n=1 Tax=Mycena alexandri TaxID=1745969 RepID=A0AAD6WR34_9AGAR|nr:hypothetical protein C8F04DRAFT_1196531 [Mycena alexandri]